MRVILDWLLAMNNMLLQARIFARRTIFEFAASCNFGVASYRQAHRKEAMRVILELRKRREMLLTPVEAWQIFSLVKATAKLSGSIAEVGVYRGASARLIREADGVRPLHLFDTFEGLPETGERDRVPLGGQFRKGDFACSLENVKGYLSQSNDIYYHQGLFPRSAEGLGSERFSFVHADVDIYESIKSVLEFFYPRMIRGGVIISHDFAWAPNVQRAFGEFLADRPEPIIELPGDQAMIVKV
jgi:O-methyltransferase